MAETLEVGEWTGFDVLKGLLALFLKERQKESDSPVQIPVAIPILHRAVYDLSREERYRELLKGYLFEQRSYFPYSRDLETDLFALEMAGHISNPNPSLSEYALSPKILDTYEKRTRERFDEDQTAVLESMATSFAQAVCGA